MTETGKFVALSSWSAKAREVFMWTAKSRRFRLTKRRSVVLVLVIVTVCCLALVIPTFSRVEYEILVPFSGFPPPPAGPLPDPAVWRGFSEQEVRNLSRLGRLLFLNDTENLHPQNRTFTILLWKHGKILERHHIKLYGTKSIDPFEYCSVKNCKFTNEDKDLNVTDAVIFHLHQTKAPSDLPLKTEQNINQRWIFLTDENPYNTFFYRSLRNKLSEYVGIFNWSMSYRLDSDVPVPYGRAVPLSPQEAAVALQNVPRNYARGKTGVAAIMGSNCGGDSHRWDYVRQLQKYVPVDVYGRCGPLKCPGYYVQNCPLLGQYKFYLAFENGNCRDYMTEKLWNNAFYNEAVPVIMGASKENCQRHLPNHSYLHTSDFASPADLGRFLIHLHQNEDEYNTYFLWKYHYKILNEHGYVQSRSYHYCRICEALNYNDPAPKVYMHPEKYLNVKDDCD